MKLKVFISLFLIGCVILFGFIFIVVKIIHQEEESQQLIDEFLSRNETPQPLIPRTEEIPDEIRNEFATVPEIPKKSEIIAEFVQGGTLQTVEFSPTNPNLVVCRTHQRNTVKNIRLWDVNNPDTSLSEFSGESVSFSPNGKILAISDLGNIEGGVKLWDIEKEKFISSLRVVGFGSVFSPDNVHLATNTSGIELWNVTNPTEPSQAIKLKGKNFEKEHTFSADGKLMATVESGTDIVNIWEVNGNHVNKKNSIHVTDGNVGWIDAMKFLPDPKNPILAIADNDEGIRLYSPPDWQNYNTIPAGTVYDFAFTPDGKTIISGGINEIEFWSVENGNRITSIEGYSSWVKCVDVSADGNFVAAGGNDGVIRVWNISTNLQEKQMIRKNHVVPIYFLPTNRLPQTDIPEKIDTKLRDLQTFFADEMERHGYGRKSFEFEKNSDGAAKVYLFEGKTADDYYNVYTSSRVLKEIKQHFELSSNFYFIIMDEIIEKKSDEKKYTRDELEKISIGIRSMELMIRNIIFRQQGGNIVVQTPLNAYATHDLAAKFGKSIGLNRDYRNSSYLMSYSEESKQLSKSSAAWLNRTQFFNSYMTNFDNKTIIEKLSKSKGKVGYEVQDADGIFQVRMLVKQNNENPPPGFKIKKDTTQNQIEWEKNYRGEYYTLHDALTLNGEKKATVEFEYPRNVDNLIELHVIDGYGNRVYMYIQLVDQANISFSSLLRRIFD